MGKVFLAIKKGNQAAYKVGNSEHQTAIGIIKPYQLKEWLNQ